MNKAGLHHLNSCWILTSWIHDLLGVPEIDISTTLKSSEIGEIQKLNGKKVNIIMKDNQMINAEILQGSLLFFGKDILIVSSRQPSPHRGMGINISEIASITPALPEGRIIRTNK